MLYCRKEYCEAALELVENQKLQEYIRIDWRDILGVKVDELKRFNFTHIMTSAAVSVLFYLRVMQVGMLLRIPTLISRVSVHAVQKEYHVFDSCSNTITHVEKFCQAELQTDPDDANATAENRNVAIVETNAVGPATIKRLNRAILNEMKQVLLKHYGFLDKSQNIWTRKAFPQKWSTIFEAFSKTGDRNIFHADTSVVFKFEPMPHVVTEILRIPVDEMVQFSTKPDAFFSYVQEFFAHALTRYNYYLLDARSIRELDIGEIHEETLIREEEIEEEVKRKKLNRIKNNKQRESKTREQKKKKARSKMMDQDNDIVEEDEENVVIDNNNVYEEIEPQS